MTTLRDLWTLVGLTVAGVAAGVVRVLLVEGGLPILPGVAIPPDIATPAAFYVGGGATVLVAVLQRVWRNRRRAARSS